MSDSYIPGQDTGVPSYQGAPKLPQLKTKDEFEAFAPGQDYIDPEGKTRTKPYTAKDPAEFEQIPEGADYVNPEGQVQTKPKYQGIGFTAQMLFDMAPDDERRLQALKAVYGGKVKKSPLGVYIDDEGTLRKPSHGGVGGELGHAGAETAPALGMIGGGVLGELSPAGPAGAFAGGVLGAMAGRQFNNMILELAGVHQSVPEAVGSMGGEGLAAATGSVAGKALSGIPGLIKGTGKAAAGVYEKAGGLVKNLSSVLEDFGITAERARSFLGTTPETAKQAARITEGGGRVEPSVFAPEAPGLAKINQFDQVFRAQNVVAEANQRYYEQEGRKILENKAIGVDVSTPLTRAEQKVSSEQAGRLALETARKNMAREDAMLEDAMREMKTTAERPVTEAGGREKVAFEHAAKLERLSAAQKASADAAKAFVDESMTQLRGEMRAGLKAASGGEDPSGLLKLTAAKFRAYNVAVKTRAGELYKAANSAAGAHLPNITPLTDEAEAFLKILPDILKSKYPVEIGQIAKLAGTEAEGKTPGIEPTDLTFGQLRQLRSWLRYGIDYNDLTPDMRQGSLKFFQKKIDAVLHSSDAVPELKTAGKMLDQADKFYRETVPYLNDQMVTTTLDALKSGAGANPEFIAKTFFDPERTTAMRKAREIVGENLWRGVEAADTATMLDGSKTMTPGVYDGKKFAAQVLDRLRNGILENGYSKELVGKVGKIVEDLGKVEGSLPINANATDTVSTLIRKSQLAAKEAEEVAARDPIKVLDQEVKKIEGQFKNAQRLLNKQRGQTSLGFLYNEEMSQKFVAAADKILSHQDLIMAAAQGFGRDSETFKALQKVYAQRFFQRSFGATAKMRSELGGEKGITDEVQALMFPGVTKGQMRQLAEDMEFLFSGAGSDVGGSMAAASRVLNPLGHLPIALPGHVAQFLTGIPGVSILARVTIGKMFAVIMDGVSHPNFMNWLAGNLKGSPAQRELARTVIRQRLKLGGLIGAAVGQTIHGQPP